MWIAIIGGGLAGTLLAWRLRSSVAVDLYTGARPPGGDATGASGGLVRGYEPDAVACRAAAESLAELRGSPVLREWAGYREIGSVFLTTAVTRSVRIVQSLLPGSATVLSAGELVARYPFRELPDGTVGVVERHAGHVSPARLRAAVLAELATSGVAIHQKEVRLVSRTECSGPQICSRVLLADGSEQRYDAVVLAAGAWTPRLLAASGLPEQGLRTKHIQYSLHSAGPAGLPAFVDDTTGLYGRPVEGGSFLLGLPSDRWDVDPDAVVPDRALAARALARAATMLAEPIKPSDPPRAVAAFDCYHPEPGLRLRQAGIPAVFTFTGGSGGAAKTVLAASRAAAGELLASPQRVGAAR